MSHFLAVHHLPAHAPESTWRDELTRLAERSHELGLRPVETVFSRERGVAYTYYEAPSVESIRELHMRTFAAPPDDILNADRLYPELLAEPRRER